jgi:predicted nucleic acid-binding protein
MGLVLDSSVLIATERDAKPVSHLLVHLQHRYEETEVIVSAITVIVLEHGLHRANTPALTRQRRAYVDTVFFAIPAEPFTKEMAQLAAKIMLTRDEPNPKSAALSHDSERGCNRALKNAE